MHLAKHCRHPTEATTDYVTVRTRGAENAGGKAMLGAVASESLLSHLLSRCQDRRSSLMKKRSGRVSYYMCILKVRISNYQLWTRASRGSGIKELWRHTPTSSCPNGIAEKRVNLQWEMRKKERAGCTMTTLIDLAVPARGPAWS